MTKAIGHGSTLVDFIWGRVGDCSKCTRSGEFAWARATRSDLPNDGAVQVRYLYRSVSGAELSSVRFEKSVMCS